MKRWRYGINSWSKTAHIYLDEAPSAVFALEDFVTFMCDHVPSIPLPRMPFKLRGEDIAFNNGKAWTTLRDWYGDLQQVFHLVVHDKVIDFCWVRTKARSVRIPYDEARELFYEEDKGWWDEWEKEGNGRRLSYAD